jgi:hypothetical protein
MDERRVDFGGIAGKGRLKRTFRDEIGQALEKNQVKNTGDWRACMRNLMKEDRRKRTEEAKAVFKDYDL